MTVAREFFNWSTKPDDPAFNRCSPNLIEVRWQLERRWQTTPNGCYGERPIRGGVVPSAHSHGAAIDENYASRLVALNEIIPWLVDYSHELHIQAIHDYFGSRIWRAGRGWKPNTTADGMGESWATYFHIESNRTGWADATPVINRSGIVIPGVNPTPTPPGGQSTVFPRILRKGDSGPDVGALQAGLRLPGAAIGNKQVAVDGNFGAQTETAVKAFQAYHNLGSDGIFGPKSQAKMMQVLNS